MGILVKKSRNEYQNANETYETCASTHSTEAEDDDFIDWYPDGGWGWVVVFGATLIRFVDSVIFHCYGLMFRDRFLYIGADTTDAALVYGLLIAVWNLTALFVGPVCAMSSHRCVALLGTCTAAAGVIMTAYTDTVTQTVITFGLVTGIGIAFSFGSSFLVLVTYFHKRQGLAAGIMSSGSAICGIVSPQIVKFLLQEYGFRGMTLLVGGLMLNGCLGACLYQPVKWHLPKTRRRSPMPCPPESQSDISKTQSFPATPNLYPEDNIYQNLPCETQDQSTPQKKLEKAKNCSRKSISVLNVLPPSLTSPLQFGSSCCDFPDLQSSYSNQFYEEDLIGNDGHRTKKKNSLYDLFHCPILDMFRLIKLSLLKCPVFLNLVFGQALMFLCLHNIKMLLPFYIRNLGFSNQKTAACISAVSFFDFFARILIPWASDTYFSRRYALILGAFLGAVSVIGISVSTTFPVILGLCLVHGMAFGSNASSEDIVYSEYFNKEDMPSAFGLSKLIIGIMSVTGGPIFGFIRDVTGEFDICLRIIGGIMIFVFLLWTVLSPPSVRPLRNCCRTKRLKNEKS